MTSLLQKFSKVLLLLLFVAILDSSPLWAQVITSSIEGRVTNSDAEPVYSAVVIAVHVESNTKYYAVANNLGHYKIDGMRPGGPYTLEFISMGYETTSFSGLYFDVAESYSFNIVLEFSLELLSGATIIAERPKNKLIFEPMGISSNISLEEKTYIATKSNTFVELLRYSPYSGKDFSLAGADSRTTKFTIDGAQFNDNFGLGGSIPGGGSPISTEAISQIQIAITPYDVRQTDFFGGGINAITKSGTNTFTGTTYIYHSNEWTRGNKVCGTPLSKTRPSEPSTTYGFTLGGPIVQNKLFFFVNFEIASNPREINKWRASTDGVANPALHISKTLEKDMERVHNYVLDKYGYDTGSWNEFPTTNNNIKALARIDWNITDKSQLSMRYNYTVNKAWHITNKKSMDGGMQIRDNRASANSMVFANSLYFDENYANSFSLNFNSRISDKLHNEFLATYSHIGKTRNSPSEQFPFIDILQENTENAPINYMSLGYELFTWNNRIINNTATVKNDLIYYGLKDKLIFGINYEHHHAYNSYMRNGTGYYRYSNLSDFLNGNEPEIVALTYGFEENTKPAVNISFNKIGIYFQESHSFSDDFKINVGTRLDYVDYDDSQLIKNDNIYNIDYSGNGFHLGQGRTFTPQQEAETIRLNTGRWPGSTLFLSPRLGFNWDLLPDKSLTISGGTGLFSGRIPLVFFVNMPITNGTVQYQAVFNKFGWYGAKEVDMSIFRGGLITDSNGKPTIDALRDYITSHKLAPQNIHEEKALPPLIAAVDPSLKVPQVWKSSIEIKYKIPIGFPLSISGEFVFNKTISEFLVKDYSVISIDDFPKLKGCDQRPLFPDNDRLIHYIDEYGNAVEVPNTYVFTNTNKGYGYIYSLSFETSPIKGLSLTAAYTHTASYNLTGMPEDHSSTIISYVPNVYGINNLSLHPSLDLIPDKIIANISFDDKWNNHYSLMLDSYRGGNNYSYMFADDMNNDGFICDLIYIPKEGDDLLFKTIDDRARFMEFVNRDKYLSSHKGEYAEAFSVYSPWVFRLNLNYAHTFSFKIGESRHRIQLNCDIKNILNMFNSSWGVEKILNPELNEGQILRVDSITPDNEPVFTTIKAITPTTEIWTPYYNVSECWYAKIGIKYFFN